MVKIPDAKELLRAGLHFGHKTQKWDPKMRPFIFGVKNGIHIFDLDKTMASLVKALDMVSAVVAKGGVVLFLGTKKQARKIVLKYATEVGMPYVAERWIGGTITNFQEICKLIKKLDKLEEAAVESDYEKKYTKKERALFGEERERLLKMIGGIRQMKKVPDLIYIVGVKEEKNATKEAQVKKIKTVGIVDTNTDPDEVNTPIYANDDAVKSIELITRLVAEAVREGQAEAVKRAAAVNPVKPLEKTE
ncbi:30S ribosomal protein S2 [Candidatus Kuenenbacteria bacterium RIFCSPHIGHO2_12_FULL_42_14]|uniref:Small ribosomal subunit protein uS2 n=1 Tax=Candidatus Kuenenbacteria bacterium RIFCSPHIGHO2_12_FULL_42_14 TaxID=1798563 RepID=A0A1F6GKV2_9BACT|nr:MAG: 30S ribosomal protein S2 [Candidatus Kuenenbacteria bacterium RIFCSPHIGHO2_12_FULL_42_14]